MIDPAGLPHILDPHFCFPCGYVPIIGLMVNDQVVPLRRPEGGEG